MLKRPRGTVKLERSGGLDYLVGGEERCVFPALLTPAQSMEVTVAWIKWTSNICAQDIWSSIRGARRAHP